MNINRTHNNHMIKGLLSLFIPLMLMAAPCANAANPAAKTAFDNMVSAMKKHPSLEIVFSLWHNGNSSTGSMDIAANRFYLSTPDMKVWYDGKTQWTYSQAAREVDITTPTADELAQTNPLSILNSLERNFTLRRLDAPATVDKIELLPKTKNPDLSSVTLTIDAKTHLPKEIAIKNSRGGVLSIKISSIKGGKNKPVSTFRFNPATYPGVDIVDLR